MIPYLSSKDNIRFEIRSRINNRKIILKIIIYDNNCNWKIKLVKISKVPNMMAEDELMLLATTAPPHGTAPQRCRRDYCRQPPLPLQPLSLQPLPPTTAVAATTAAATAVAATAVAATTAAETTAAVQPLSGHRLTKPTF